MSAVLQAVPKPRSADDIEVTRALPGQEQLLTPAALAFLPPHPRFGGAAPPHARAERLRIQYPRVQISAPTPPTSARAMAVAAVRKHCRRRVDHRPSTRKM